MMASDYLSPLNTKLDANQVLRRAYDEPNNRLRVDATVTASIGTVDVVIDAASGDNISISDGVDTLAINSDGSINAVVTLSAAEQDSVLIVGTEDATVGGTQHVAKVNALGELSILQANKLIPQKYDLVQVIQKDADGNFEIIRFRDSGTLVATLTITYDVDGDISTVQRT